MENSQMKLGAILSYLNIFLLNGINLVFTPYMLKCLGQAQYGLYALIGSFVGYLMVLDFGLNNTIVRYVAKYRAEKNRRDEENFLAMSMLIYCALSICIVIAGIVLYNNLHNFFGNSMSASELSQAKIMFVILLFNLAVTLPLNAFPAVLTAYEEFVFPRMLTIFRVIARTGALVILLTAGYGAVTIVLLDTVLNILFMLLNIAFVLVKLKVKIKFHGLDKVLLVEMFSFSFFIFLNLIVDQVYWRIGQLILGVVATTASVAVFAVGMQLTGYYTQLSTAVSGVFLPRATQMMVNNASGEEMTDLMIKSGRLQFVILGFVLSGLLLFGRQFVVLWAGEGYVQAWTIAVCVMVPLTVPLFQNVGLSILQAKNKHAFRSVAYVFIAAANVAISFYMAKKFGTIGAAFGTAFSLVAGNILIINLYYHKAIGLNMIRFFKGIFRGLIPAMLIAGLAGVCIRMISGSGWINLAVKGLLFSMAYVLVLWLMGLNRYEKNLFSGPIKTILRKLGWKAVRENGAVS